jgi:[acyl-carrier-protein] S-malonyltransferase
VGALAFADGVRLVSERGRLMAGIQDERPGAMAAIIGLDQAKLEELVDRASSEGTVQLANLNSPEQIVVSGEEAPVDRLIELANDAGAKRALRLQVGAAFHSDLMKPVQAKLADLMTELEWHDLAVPLVADYSGQPVQAAADVRTALIEQIASPVRWVDCVRTLKANGVGRAVELGPGRVLAGLVRRIEPEIEVTPAESRDALASYVSGASQL